jgi:hypothetical protein
MAFEAEDATGLAVVAMVCQARWHRGRSSPRSRPWSSPPPHHRRSRASDLRRAGLRIDPGRTRRKGCPESGPWGCPSHGECPASRACRSASPGQGRGGSGFYRATRTRHGAGAGCRVHLHGTMAGGYDGLSGTRPRFGGRDRLARQRSGRDGAEGRDLPPGGRTAVWVVYPGEQQVVVYTPDGPPGVCGGAETLDGGDVLPGLILPVRAIFSGSACGARIPSRRRLRMDRSLIRLRLPRRAPAQRPTTMGRGREMVSR